MKVYAWQTGSQGNVFPLLIYCKCQLSYCGAKLNMHTHTLTLQLEYQLSKLLQLPQIFAQLYTALGINSNLHNLPILKNGM